MSRIQEKRYPTIHKFWKCDKSKCTYTCMNNWTESNIQVQYAYSFFKIYQWGFCRAMSLVLLKLYQLCSAAVQAFRINSHCYFYTIWFLSFNCRYTGLFCGLLNSSKVPCLTQQNYLIKETICIKFELWYW